VKKLLTCVLIAVFMVTLSATGFAAQKTFSDVPAKHWAYEAVAKLAKAGLIEGYDDGTYRGDKPMNRYEFAIATVKAIDRYDRADNEQRKLIDKLSAEFAAELNRMGARLAKVETKTNTWLVGGDTRFRLLTNNPKYPDGTKLRGSDMTDFRVRLKFAGNQRQDLHRGRLTTTTATNSVTSPTPPRLSAPQPTLTSSTLPTKRRSASQNPVGGRRSTSSAAV
jgi:hypothetical protein